MGCGGWNKDIIDLDSPISFWMDSDEWGEYKSVEEVLERAFLKISNGFGENANRKSKTLTKKVRNFWKDPILIVLDGVNEGKCVKSALMILNNYFDYEEVWAGKIKFLFTTRPLELYKNYRKNFWEGCFRIGVNEFTDLELNMLLKQKNIPIKELSENLRELARIPRYSQICIRLRNKFNNFDLVTKELIFLVSLEDKIEGDNQLRINLGLRSSSDLKEVLSAMAQKCEWIEDDPRISKTFLLEEFSDFQECRKDLIECRFISKNFTRNYPELNTEYVVLGWAFYLLETLKGSKNQNFLDVIYENLEPMPENDFRTRVIFLCLQLTALSKISSEIQLVLFNSWYNSHNANTSDDRLEFWANENPNLYSSFIENQLALDPSLQHGSSRDLTGFLKKVWRNEVDKKEDRYRHSYLEKWLRQPAMIVKPQKIEPLRTSNDFRINQNENHLEDIRRFLSLEALSILSQRPDPSFLEILARCMVYVEKEREENRKRRSENKIPNNKWGIFDKLLHILVRHGYTELILKDLEELFLLSKKNNDSELEEGIFWIQNCFGLVKLPFDFSEYLTKKHNDQRNRWIFYAQQDNNNRFINQIRNNSLFSNELGLKGLNSNFNGLGELVLWQDLQIIKKDDRKQIKIFCEEAIIEESQCKHRSETLSSLCLKNLMPWLARFNQKEYLRLSCDFKSKTIESGSMFYILTPFHGIIFEEQDNQKITSSILNSRNRFVSRIHFGEWDRNSQLLTDLNHFTEILLFTSSEKELFEWLDFLSQHEYLRCAINSDLLKDNLFPLLIPESISSQILQKVEMLSNINPPKKDHENNFSELKYWNILKNSISNSPELEWNEINSDFIKIEERLENFLNERDILKLVGIAISSGHKDKLWNIIHSNLLLNKSLSKRILAVSILTWITKKESTGLLERISKEDPSMYVREHAKWGYTVSSQQERSMKFYRKSLQSFDLYQILSAFEILKPVLTPFAFYWTTEVEKEVFKDQLDKIDSKLKAFLMWFWHYWIKIYYPKQFYSLEGKKIDKYYRGENVQFSLDHEKFFQSLKTIEDFYDQP